MPSVPCSQRLMIVGHPLAQTAQEESPMQMVTVVVASLLMVSVAWTALAQDICREIQKAPVDAIRKAAATGERSRIRIQETCRELLLCKVPNSQEALVECAEKLKGFGDYYAAEKYYREAILFDNNNPHYELLYADYLRVFRGPPNRPLFQDAEAHYFEALRKIEAIQDKQRTKHLQYRVERGLLALYETDGLPLVSLPSLLAGTTLRPRPWLSLASINTWGRETTSLDANDDIRKFTSEVLFARSPMRRNSLLSAEELKAIAGWQEQFETFDRLRFRYKQWPVLDLFFKYHHIDAAQVTNSFEPTSFNDVKLHEYGLTIERTLSLTPAFDGDLLLRGTFKRIDREGTIEFHPDRSDRMNHVEVETALSRFFGPNRGDLAVRYIFQDIHPDIPAPPQRMRQIVAVTLSYRIARGNIDQHPDQATFRERVETQHSWNIFGGAVYDSERFGNIDVTKYDFFVGTALRRLAQRFDITLQPTFFTGNVEKDPSQDQKQYRTNLTLLYRIIDEEDPDPLKEQELEQAFTQGSRGIHTTFLHLIMPLRHDIALEGPRDFENVRLGLGLAGKFFSKTLRGPTFLVSASYAYQYYYHLHKDLNLVNVTVSMGF